MNHLNVFKGTIKICLWIRYKHDQQSGPPLKNALVGVNSEERKVTTETCDEATSRCL